ncbi:LOW QUALITY PROTEIN: hypothetical protein ACHAXR_012955 [Thalassiosira sp. AJA248-18]
MDSDQENVFQQILNGAEEEIAMQQQQALDSTQVSEEVEDPGRFEITTHDRYAPDTGFGTALVDASNALNKINQYLILWNTYYRWNTGSRFAVNRYRHHNIVYSTPVDPPLTNTSQEGGAQGNVYGGFIYGSGLMPLTEQMRKEMYPQSFTPGLPMTWLELETEQLLYVRRGPNMGFFTKPEKSWYICKGKDEANARAAFEA